MTTRHGPKRQSNPFSGVIDFVGEMNRGWDRMHGSEPRTQIQQRSHIDAWTPAADILATGDALVIRVDVPGVERGDIEVTYTASTLTISGQRQLAEDEQQATYHTKERSWGRFRRSISLPEGVDQEDISVDLTAGVLRITVRGYSNTEGPAHLEIDTHE